MFQSDPKLTSYWKTRWHLQVSTIQFIAWVETLFQSNR